MASEPAAEAAALLPPLLTAPAQFNLFTRELESLPIEVPDPGVARELRIDDGITLVKSDDAQITAGIRIHSRPRTNA